LIRVPTDEYKCLDDAIASLEPYKGGYVIQLIKAGVYELNKNICQSVDYLEIIGDCSENVGVGYFQGSRPPSASISLVQCLNTPIIGAPPFRLTTNGPEITVTGSTNPDFTNLCPGRKVGVLYQDGTIGDFYLASVCRNTIVLDQDPQLGNDPIIGEGFFIYPDVTIKSEQVSLKMVTSKSLYMQGIDFKVPYPFTAGTSGLKMNLLNCVIYNMYIYGCYEFTSPNVWLGICQSTPSSFGRAVFQSFVGLEATLVADSNAYSAWYVSFFCGTVNGAKVQNGGGINFFGSAFYNNLLGLYVSTRGSATIQGTSFVGNKFALSGFYKANASSYLIDGSPAEQYRPFFLYNYVALNIGYQSQVICPNAVVANNDITYILDGSIIPNTYGLNVGQYGHLGSLIIIFFNPVSPQYTTSLENSDSAQNTLNSTNIGGANSITSAASIASVAPLPSGSSSATYTQSGVGTLTGVYNSIYGTPIRITTPSQPLVSNLNPTTIPNYLNGPVSQILPSQVQAPMIVSPPTTTSTTVSTNSTNSNF
jgi:hypothetical protein